MQYFLINNREIKFDDKILLFYKIENERIKNNKIN